jgi:hypothetical protein
MKDFQYITNSHPAYIENLYNDFLQNPESVEQDLRKFFEGFDFAVSNGLNGKAATTSVATAPIAAVDWMSEIRVWDIGIKGIYWPIPILFAHVKIVGPTSNWNFTGYHKLTWIKHLMQET